MIAAVASWRLGVQDGLILARIQVSPLPFWLMVVQLACRSTFRTRPMDHVVVPEPNVDLSSLLFQFHRVHVPGSLDPQNSPIKFSILHPRNCRMPPSQTCAVPLQTLNSQKEFVLGNPDPNHISTSFVERQNLNMRMQMYSVDKRL